MKQILKCEKLRVITGYSEVRPFIQFFPSWMKWYSDNKNAEWNGHQNQKCVFIKKKNSISLPVKVLWLFVYVLFKGKYLIMLDKLATPVKM